jgi:hypothetical protein
MKITLTLILVISSQLVSFHAQQPTAAMPKVNKPKLFTGGKKIFEDEFTSGADKLWILPKTTNKGLAEIEKGILKFSCADSEGASIFLKLPIENVKGVSVSFLTNIEKCSFLAFAFGKLNKEPFILRFTSLGNILLVRHKDESGKTEELLVNTKAKKVESYDAKKWYRVRFDMTKDEIAVIVNGNIIQHAKNFGGLTLDYDRLRISSNAGNIQLDEIEIEVKP